MLGPPTTLRSNAFGYITLPDGFRIYVPAAYLETYQAATNWSAFADYMVGY